MKRIIFSIALLFITLQAKSKMEYAISLVGMNMDYREYDRFGNILDSEKSQFRDIMGAEFSYRFFLTDYSNIEFNALSVDGNTQYKGSYLASSSGYGSLLSKTSNKVRDISLGYNLNKIVNSHFKILGGLAFGYRYWQRELSSVQIEVYEWYSLRTNIGMQVYYNNLSASLIAEYQYGITPTMNASGFSNDFELSSANIIKISLPVRLYISKKFDFICAYSIEEQKIKRSNVVYSGGTGYVEPDSTAYNQYIKIGVIFKY